MAGKGFGRQPTWLAVHARGIATDDRDAIAEAIRRCALRQHELLIEDVLPALRVRTPLDAQPAKKGQ